MAARRPYVRPVQPGWWRRNPYFVRYMAREVTAPFVALYALILLSGLVCLAAGPDAWRSYIEALQSRAALALHVVLVGIFTYHTFSWFAIMPKTMPPVIVDGRRMEAGAITGVGLVAATICMCILWIVAGGAA